MVALKLIHPHLATDREFIDMFKDEAELAAMIRHPNVCGVLDFDPIRLSACVARMLADACEGPLVLPPCRIPP